MVAAVTARKRRYDAQNWRAAPHFSSVPVAQTSRLCMSPLCAGDVSAILTDEGSMVEWVKYSAYGVPFGLPAGDTDSDGDWDGDDKGRIGSGAYDVRKDVNLDGVADTGDISQANAVTGGEHTMGRGVLSAGGPGGAVGNRRGYAGYEYAPELEGTGAAGRHLYHVRNRVYDADVGRWTRRDPLGYVDGMGLYEYVKSRPLIAVDPTGQLALECAAGAMFGGTAAAIGAWLSGGNVGCAMANGAFTGCCTVLVCEVAPAFCVAGGCLCGLLGSAIQNICEGSSIDACLAVDLILGAASGCLGGVGYDADTLAKWIIAFTGLDYQLLSTLCPKFRTAFPPPAGTPGVLPGGKRPNLPGTAPGVIVFPPRGPITLYPWNPFKRFPSWPYVDQPSRCGEYAC
ncbi:MAG: RHS repeat-associated core domain-containing protein [Phycisphaerales bacterium]|nr:RHS repeat-associated core domain-containing protein [Phycisphaerales bacterium]